MNTHTHTHTHKSGPDAICRVSLKTVKTPQMSTSPYSINIQPEEWRKNLYKNDRLARSDPECHEHKAAVLVIELRRSDIHI